MSTASSFLAAGKRLLLRLLPESFNPRVRLTKNLTSLAAGRVLGGPFKGMLHVDRAVAGAYFPELLGIYEREIHGAIEGLVAWRPTQVIHIGAAEGYYLVGMALRTKSPQVAFESLSEGQLLCAQLAQMNHVEHLVEIRGHCAVSDLQELTPKGPRVGVICDVEGAEVELLDPEKVPWLRQSWIIVECHPESAPLGVEKLQSTFASTHDIELLQPLPRHLADCPKTSWWDWSIPAYYRIRFVSDGRQQQTPWLVLRPKS